MSNVNEYLQQLGLSKNVVELYLLLLQLGPIEVKDLAQKAGIPRSTAYTYLDVLKEKELITKQVSEAGIEIIALEPEEALSYVVKQKLQEDKMLNDELPKILKTLKRDFPPLEKEQLDEARIRFYQGKFGIHKLYTAALQASEIRSYVNIEEVLAGFPQNSVMFDRALKRNPNIKIFEICEDSPRARDRARTSDKNHHYKILPKDSKLFSQDMLIYNDTIAIIHLSQRPTGIVITNKTIATNFALIFDLLWKTL